MSVIKYKSKYWLDILLWFLVYVNGLILYEQNGEDWHWGFLIVFILTFLYASLLSNDIYLTDQHFIIKNRLKFWRKNAVGFKLEKITEVEFIHNKGTSIKVHLPNDRSWNPFYNQYTIVMSAKKIASLTEELQQRGVIVS
ncbi:MAG TPA: hypothetical protein DCS93_13995 [Microscillaceae bacterium]|nr:hypothetical protein [Microscillaceae bacterium]